MKTIGKYAYDPESTKVKASIPVHDTFSVAIFQWLEKKNGRGLKKGKCVVRVVAKKGDIKRAFAKADEIVKQLNAGEWTGPTKVKLK